RTLRRWGFRVDVATEGDQALRLASEITFDVVIADIAMPGVTGVELLRLIHKQDPDLPILLVTGEPTMETAIEAVQHSAFAYLTKPVGLDTLRDTVTRAVRAHKMASVRRHLMETMGDEAFRVAERLELQAQFTQALAGLFMVYQPIV